MEDSIVIRRLESIPDMLAFNELRELNWCKKCSAYPHQMISMSRNGGFLLGAFYGETMVALQYSFPSFLNGQIYLWSKILGISQDWSSKGLGERLMRMQAETAKEAGYPMIAWTYDPLEPANGYLNICKLGAVCSTYHMEYYGVRPDQLHQGLAFDHFQMEWWLDQPKEFLLPHGPGESLIDWQLNSAGWPQPSQVIETIPDTEKLVVSVPANFQKLIQHDFELAKTWREITRQVFIKCFDHGWALTGLNLRKSEPVYEYVLVKRCTLQVPKSPW